MVEGKYSRDIAFRKVVRRTIIFGIFLGIVIGGAILIVVPKNQSDLISVSVGPEIEGTLEQSLEYTSYTGKNRTRICEITDFTTKPVLWFTGSGEELFVENQERGFKISGRDYVIAIQMTFHILIDIYENVTFTFSISDVSGNATIRTTMSFRGLAGSYTELRQVDSGQIGEITIQESLLPLRTWSESWIIEAELDVYIAQDLTGSITMDKMAIDIDSNAPIYPFQIRFNDQTGVNIYDTIGSQDMIYHPLLNVTDDTLMHSVCNEEAFITGRATNGTTYLPTGNYTIEYGWGPYWYTQFVGTFTVELQSGVAAYAEVTLLTSRLFLEIDQNVPVDVWIEDSGAKYVLFLWNDQLQPDYFIFLPADNGPTEISVRPTTIPSIWFIDTTVDIEGTRNYTIRATFPVFVFTIFVFDAVQLLLVLIVIGTIIASVISLHKLYDKQPIRNIISNKEFIPFMLAISSVFLPWFSNNEMLYENGTNIYRYRMYNIPTNLMLEGRTDSLFAFSPIEYFSFELLQWTYWFVVIIIILRLLDLLHSESRLGIYSPYIVLSLIGIVLMFPPSWYEISIGPFLLIASLLAMIFLRTNRGKGLADKLTKIGE